MSKDSNINVIVCVSIVQFHVPCVCWIVGDLRRRPVANLTYFLPTLFRNLRNHHKTDLYFNKKISLKINTQTKNSLIQVQQNGFIIESSPQCSAHNRVETADSTQSKTTSFRILCQAKMAKKIVPLNSGQFSNSKNQNS